MLSFGLNVGVSCDSLFTATLGKRQTFCLLLLGDLLMSGPPTKTQQEGKHSRGSGCFAAGFKYLMALKRCFFVTFAVLSTWFLRNFWWFVLVCSM